MYAVAFSLEVMFFRKTRQVKKMDSSQTLKNTQLTASKFMAVNCTCVF